MLKSFLIALALSFAALAALPAPSCGFINCYSASTGTVSLSATGLAATVQQPASGPYSLVAGIKAVVTCSVVCSVTRSYGGSGATATAAQGSIVQVTNPAGTAAPRWLFFAPSNASGGTPVDTTSVTGSHTFDLSDIAFGTISGQVYTISIAPITGTANITFTLAVH